ncbi:MAG: triose-phosphate isomerase [Rickettsiella sp.]|nr:triose-phosphate isomerase [Rickettsiella sp.]
MRENFVIGNWKMNGNLGVVKELLTTLKSNTLFHANVKLIICPPYVYLDQTQALLRQSQIAWCAQNMAAEKKGAYTGEISGTMLCDFGCHYVLIGHSERRNLYGETDKQIAKKFKLAIELGITPILCIGETLAQRQAEQTQFVLTEQIKTIMSLDEDISKPWILAYEPVWAIGTGVSASPVQAQDVHQFLRKYIACKYPDLAQKLPILYGGSVKPDNAKALFQMPDIDGGLIGGASLHAREFLKIYEDCCVRAD